MCASWCTARNSSGDVDSSVDECSQQPPLELKTTPSIVLGELGRGVDFLSVFASCTKYMAVEASCKTCQKSTAWQSGKLPNTESNIKCKCNSIKHDIECDCVKLALSDFVPDANRIVRLDDRAVHSGVRASAVGVSRAPSAVSSASLLGSGGAFRARLAHGMI